jgi:hypothetical protein
MKVSRWLIGLAAMGVAGHALYRRALARNPVGVLDAADLALRGGRSGIACLARRAMVPIRSNAWKSSHPPR